MLSKKLILTDTYVVTVVVAELIRLNFASQAHYNTSYKYERFAFIHANAGLFFSNNNSSSLRMVMNEYVYVRLGEMLLTV